MKHRHDRIQFLSLSVVCNYPDYPGELDAMGKVTVGFTKGDIINFKYAWTSCDSPGEVLGLVWNPVVVQDRGRSCLQFRFDWGSRRVI